VKLVFIRAYVKGKERHNASAYIGKEYVV
jgi:hypothetical protein